MFTPSVHEVTRAGTAIVPATEDFSLVIPMSYVGEPDIPRGMDAATYRHVRGTNRPRRRLHLHRAG
jgi:hypothetical protein